MEEVPQGTFEDELEWCIHQLETGLMCRNPTPKQVSDAQRVIQVLRSRKAPFVKKRAVMNRVFGNYRLKMSEERKEQQHQAADNPPVVHVEEGTTLDSQSICYRKCSKDTPGSSSAWFSASGNTFSFDFCIEELEQDTEEILEDAEENQVGPIRDGHELNQDSIYVPGEKSGFSFNFQIPEDKTSPSPSTELQVSVEKTNVAVESENGVKSEVMTVIAESAVPASLPVQQEETGKGSADPPRKKKKKKGAKGGIQDRGKEMVQKGGKSKAVAEEMRTELRREVDWCVEQLEKGLQKQKSTAKLVEEAMRAIKTLRSEKAVLVKKRQVMRAMFGDYRSKMEEEKRKQLRLMQTVSDAQRQKNSKVFRQRSGTAGRATDANPASAAQDSQAQHQETNDGPAFLFRPSQETFCFNFQL
uniref:Uncharacterized protein n=1 Tax=Leptobrachium leishanense TaxID=445787 RepID=A0A8C5R5P1_9ANUR